MMTDVLVKEAGNKGNGVFVLRAFAKGEFLFRRRYKRVLAYQDISQLSEEDQRHIYQLDWNTCAILLPPGCYLNHSCDPNAMRKGVNVFAWKEIQPGEEITIDYRLNAFTGEIVRVVVQTARDRSSAVSFPYAKTNNVSTCLTRQRSFATSIFNGTSSSCGNPVV